MAILNPAYSEPSLIFSKPEIALEKPGAIEPVSVKLTSATVVSAVCKISPESASVPSSPHSTKNDISDEPTFVCTTSLIS